MIHKMTKLSALLLCGGLVVGCASTNENADLQAQIDDMKAQTTAAEASAAAAETKANETDAKLDRMFKKSMSK